MRMKWIIFFFLLLLLSGRSDAPGMNSKSVCNKHSKLVCKPDPVVVKPGSNATLRFELHPSCKVSMKVDWTREGVSVHLSRGNKSYELEDGSPFKDRTQLASKDLDNGIIALTLFNVTTRDGGTYTCSLPKIFTKSNITLKIESESEGPGNMTDVSEGPGRAEPDPKRWSAGKIGGVFLFCFVVAALGIGISVFLYYRSQNTGNN